MRQDESGERDRKTLSALALNNAEAIQGLHNSLIFLRIKRGISRERVAELLGKPVQEIEQFEGQDYSPRLTEVSAYALAVGARFGITVELA